MTSQIRSKQKLSTFGICSHFAAWRPLYSSEWTQFWPKYSQLYKDTIRILTLYLLHLKVKARPHNVTRISKSQRLCDTCFLVKFHQGIRSVCPLGLWSYFQQFIVKVRYRLCKKGQISNVINVNRKVSVRCVLSPGIRWCLLGTSLCSMRHLKHDQKCIWIISTILWYLRLVYSGTKCYISRPFIYHALLLKTGSSWWSL